MQGFSDPETTANPNSSKNIKIAIECNDFSEYLKAIGISYVPNGYYWQVGQITAVQGWILHLSVVRSQIAELLTLIVPLLISEYISFKIVRNRETARLLLDGHLGEQNVGKIVSIYPESDLQSLRLAEKLIDVTKLFNGPEIPTDICLGSIVYARYGSFNPVQVKAPDGETLKCIYDNRGKLLPDLYEIPFRLPKGVSFPFDGLVRSLGKMKSALLKHTYYPISILKNDVKGRVVKALYFRKFWQIKACILKEGCKNVLSDDAGRDVQDRLRWQFDLYHRLAGVVPLPELFDRFEEGGKLYLAMEFINGITLVEYIANIYRDCAWKDLRIGLRLRLVEYLSQILEIVQRLHQNEFVHRDITAENFLIDRKGKIFLIDMELSWSSEAELPSPPFQLGTPGYMSPQQFAEETPTVKDDIYALGALILVFLTNLLPTSLPTDSVPKLKNALLFFTADVTAAEIVANCLAADPLKRPTLAEIGEWVLKFKTTLQAEILTPIKGTRGPSRDTSELKDTVQAGINGLATSLFLSPKQKWLSMKRVSGNQTGNAQLEKTFYEGWATGMAGPLWVVARAKISGFNVDSCQTAYTNSWSYLQQSYSNDSTDYNPGLFSGGAGIALALAEGFASGMVSVETESIGLLLRCFAPQVSSLSIRDGAAGQGIALLGSARWMDQTTVNERLEFNKLFILKNQQKNGSWRYSNETKKNKNKGFDDGVPGIIWFLLSYLERFPKDTAVHTAATKAMQWLIGETEMTASNKRNIGKIDIHTILVFLKAFEILADPLYQKLSVWYLTAFPFEVVWKDFTFASGIAGLGELYLEAYRVLKDPEWNERACWIADLLIRCCRPLGTSQGYWATSAAPGSITADLFNGNAGVLHFLIRTQRTGLLTHPLWTIS